MLELPTWLASKIMPEPNTGCWLWFGAIDSSGYGRIHLGRINGVKHLAPAHRLVWEFYNGAVSDELVIDPLCRQRCCVNPEHLEPVSEQTNILRGTGASTRNAKKLQCDNGHSLTDAYLINGATRKCRVCQLASMKSYYRKKHAPR